MTLFRAAFYSLLLNELCSNAIAPFLAFIIAPIFIHMGLSYVNGSYNRTIKSDISIRRTNVLLFLCVVHKVLWNGKE